MLFAISLLLEVTEFCISKSLYVIIPNEYSRACCGKRDEDRPGRGEKKLQGILTGGDDIHEHNDDKNNYHEANCGC